MIKTITCRQNIKLNKKVVYQLPFDIQTYKKLLNFNNKVAVMLRRKNPEHTYLQPQSNHSPYRFQRKNINLSPGLSPLRCRTPTRANISPFRTTNNHDNYRAHSPIKFVTSKLPNPTNQISKGFFRTENHTNYQPQYNQKYATSNNNNNDYSTKRQSFYENPSSSKINAPYQNSQRTIIHQNTKLFSKLVQKINSQKKKQPELARRNTKPQIYRPQQISHVEQKPSGVDKLTKQKSQTDQLKIQTINQHIKPIQSVVYEEKQVRTYTYQHQMNNYTVSGKENKEIEHEQSYKLKQHKVEKTYSVGLQITKNNNLKAKEEDKPQMQPKAHPKSTASTKKDEQVQKEKSLKKEVQKQQQINKISSQNNVYKIKPHEQKKELDYNDPNTFDDLDMLLGKISNVPKSGAQTIKESIGNKSQASNVYSSINMDPFL